MASPSLKIEKEATPLERGPPPFSIDTRGRHWRPQRRRRRNWATPSLPACRRKPSAKSQTSCAFLQVRCCRAVGHASSRVRDLVHFSSRFCCCFVNAFIAGTFPRGVSACALGDDGFAMSSRRATSFVDCCAAARRLLRCCPAGTVRPCVTTFSSHRVMRPQRCLKP